MSEPEYDFYISYPGPDEKVAAELYEALQAQSEDYKVFLDSKYLKPGDDWSEVLSASLERARIVVVLLSSNTKSARSQPDEIRQALGLEGRGPHGLRVVPVFLDDESWNVAKSFFGLATKQGIDLRKSRGVAGVAVKLHGLLEATASGEASPVDPATEPAPERRPSKATRRSKKAASESSKAPKKSAEAEPEEPPAPPRISIAAAQSGARQSAPSPPPAAAPGPVPDDAEPAPATIAEGAVDLRPAAPDLTADRPFDEARRDRIVHVQQTVFAALKQGVTRPDQDVESTTLDVHIRPSLRRQTSEALRGVDPEMARAAETDNPYSVLLSLHRKENGQERSVRYFDGPLQLPGGGLRPPRGRGDPNYGEALHRALFHDQLPGGYDRLVDGAPGLATLAAGYQQARGLADAGALRVQLRIDSSLADLHRHAWEYLWDPGLPEPVACSPRTPFARFLHVSGAGGLEQLDLRNGEKLRLMAVMSSPAELDDESNLFAPGPLQGLQAIQQAELDSLLEGLAGLERLEPLGPENLMAPHLGRVTLEALDRRLSEAADLGRPYHALHLLCHGIEGDDRRGYLVLESETPRDHPLVDEATFAEWIGRHVHVDQGGKAGLRLVVLASCFTARPTEGHALRGVARRLVERGVPAVVAMQETLQYESAQHFSQRLYRHLLRSGEVDKAVNAARLELYKRRGTTVRADEWGIPVLFMRLPAGRLFLVDETAGAPETEEETRARTFAETPGADPRGLARRAVTLAGAALGMNLSVDAAALGRALARGLRAEVPPEAAGAARAKPPWIELGEVDLDPAALETELEVPQAALDQAVAALDAGKHVILTGPPGTGKTTLAEDLCRLARAGGSCRGHVLATATSDWTTFDTIGGYLPGTDGRLYFRRGVFLDAIRSQRWLVIDEINRADIDKAFGELFTVLSGQAVTLPYQVDGRPVRIRTGARPAHDSEYVISPSWRIVATMNVYDRASLFAMSKAFMRRFAFVDVDVPEPATYAGLLASFLERAGLDLAEDHAVKTLLGRLFRAGTEAENPLMHWRSLGPAIALDVVRYLRQRQKDAGDLSAADMADALALYVVPQLDDLEPDQLNRICAFLDELFPERPARALRRRIRALFPYLFATAASEEPPV